MLVYAHRRDATDHAKYRAWLEGAVGSGTAYGLSELVLSAFVRVVTHTRVFPVPTPTAAALDEADNLRTQPNCVLISPGSAHWEIFAGLCRKADVKGGLVADAYLAALAIESGSEWITTDRDFSRFPGLRWRHPLS